MINILYIYREIAILEPSIENTGIFWKHLASYSNFLPFI